MKYLIIFSLFFLTSCFGSDGDIDCGKYISEITIGNKAGLNVYPIHRKLEYSKNISEEGPFFQNKIILCGGEFYHDFGDEFYFEFEIDTNGSIKINLEEGPFYSSICAPLIQNIELNNKQNYNEVYCLTPNKTILTKNTRHVLYAMKKGDKIKAGECFYNYSTSEKKNFIIMDSLYSPSFVNGKISAIDNEYNIVLTPLNNDTLFYPIAFTNCHFNYGWIECTYKNNEFYINELVIVPPYISKN